MPPKRETRQVRDPLTKSDGNKVKKSSAKPQKGSVSKQNAKSKASPKSSPRQAPDPSSESGSASTAQEITRSNSSRKNYLFLVHLSGVMDPQITRTLSVPSNLTFAKFHAVVQTAFGWANAHMYMFKIFKQLAAGEASAWGHERGHWLYNFVLHPTGLERNDNGPEERCSRDWTLAQIYDDKNLVDRIQVEYEYDMGDGWEHDVVFLGVEPPTLRKAMQIPADWPVVCISGEGHPCAEDSGGVDGWEDLRDLFAKPRSRDEDDRKSWYKTACLNGDPKGLPNPWVWSILDVNDELAKLAKEPKFMEGVD